ncbi:YtxH domain-containing protein [Rubricoccus marinus]|uniref:YtxH domain-containing protein n=1 Tax=Rubricoccus marinus TaxID=716817 RepID=A0A259TZK7_9BACT|nr:YtxH domain-containing protein [Rubricoccus marinus]OZC03161.1 hypothetical protein BSZ36_09350 [Rubricoccus marinus]
MRDSTFLDRFLLAASAFGAGLALGLLLAPEAGRDTRDRIASGAREASAAAQEKSRELAVPVADRARATAQTLAERHLPLAEDWEVVDPDTLRDALRSDLTRG